MSMSSQQAARSNLRRTPWRVATGSALAVTALLAACALMASALPADPTSAARFVAVRGSSDGPLAEWRHPQSRWVAAWEGSAHGGIAINPPGFNCPADRGLEDQTVRNLVFVSAGGDQVRVRLTNAFGSEPLRVGAASVALSAQGARVVRGTQRTLRFGGRPSVLIAAGGAALSDPVDLRVEALQTLTVSIYLPDATGPATEHFNARQNSYVGAGNQARSSDGAELTSVVTCWMFTDGVDVRASSRVRGAVVALGDSITDGENSAYDANLRYPDQLARRLHARPGPTLSVANAGISGNTVLRTRMVGGLTMETASARLDRDVLTRAGVTDVILLEGINDIGDGAHADEIIGVLQQIIAAAHAAGVNIYGGTLTPFGGSNAFGGEYGTARGEAQRQAVNAWIRTAGAFDGVFDFDRAVRDPTDPTRLRPAYDSGDHLHPSAAGYAAIAGAVELHELIRR
jgi:lysophospholipase L1-like esterase